MKRGSRWPGGGRIEDRETPLPLCRCQFCRRRFRVLPAEIAPFKSYTRPIIETACAAYIDAQLPEMSLQKTVALMGPGHPHRSALHGWLGGMGARALGRRDVRGGGPPVSALIAESGVRLRGEVFSWWEQRFSIPPAKYRSPQRQERLQACARLFTTAHRLFPQSAHAWCAWESWLQTRFHVTAWSFPARLAGTAIQHHGPRSATVQCAPAVKDLPAAPAAAQAGPKRQKKGKAHGARSPP